MLISNLLKWQNYSPLIADFPEMQISRFETWWENRVKGGGGVTNRIFQFCRLDFSITAPILLSWLEQTDSNLLPTFGKRHRQLGFCDSDDKFPDYKVRIKIIFNVIHLKRLQKSPSINLATIGASSPKWTTCKKSSDNKFNLCNCFDENGENIFLENQAQYICCQCPERLEDEYKQFQVDYNVLT